MLTVRTLLAAVSFIAVACACSTARVAFPRETRVGVNLPDIGSGQYRSVIFVDAMKQAAPWSNDVSPIGARAGDVQPPHQGAATTIYRGCAFPAGDYTLLYDGKGTFAFGPGGTIVSHSPGRIVARIVPSPEGIRLRLTSSDLRNPARNIRLIVPGFERTYASAPFHPSFVRVLRSFDVLRFERWMHADSFVSTAVWPDRPKTTRAMQVAPQGVAPEYMVALANATGTDPWFTLPVGATDMYIYQFAALVHQTLDPRLHPIFEYGGDVWKPGTPTNAYAAMAGRNVHLAGDRATAALGWYSLRSTQMFALVRRAFGADAARVNVLLSGPLAASPAGKEASIDEKILTVAQAGRHADAFAIAMPSDGGSAALAVTTTIVARNSAGSLALVAYDGGPRAAAEQLGSSGQVIPAALAAPDGAPAMRLVVSEALETWHAAGGTLFVGTLRFAQPGTTRSSDVLGVDDYRARHPSSHVRLAGSPTAYMPALPPSAASAPAPPVPVAAECRSPQCAPVRDSARAFRTFGRASSPERRRTSVVDDDDSQDYRL